MFSQSTSDSLGNKSAKWVHQRTYDHIIQNKLFKDGMSDDEMAGMLLYRGGKNLRGAFLCELFGIISVSLYTVVYPNNEPVGKGLAVVGVGFFVAGIANLLSGYNKISKAGIIMQHKGIFVKATASGISLTF
jgi:hypothetical protein